MKYPFNFLSFLEDVSLEYSSGGSVRVWWHVNYSSGGSVTYSSGGSVRVCKVISVTYPSGGGVMIPGVIFVQGGSLNVESGSDPGLSSTAISPIVCF
jgi:hypothetical protein